MSEEEKLPRRERDRLRHKEEILTAALRLFAERGFHEVSMQEIAAQAEFATGTLYNFFASKEALFEELTQRCADMIIGDLGSILDSDDDEVTILRRFFRRQPEMLEKHADFIKMYVSEMGTRAARHAENHDHERVDNALNPKICRLIESGVGKGLFRSVDPAVTALAIDAVLETLAFELAGRVDRAELTDSYAKVEQLFVDGLLSPEGHQ